MRDSATPIARAPREPARNGPGPRTQKAPEEAVTLESCFFLEKIVHLSGGSTRRGHVHRGGLRPAPVSGHAAPARRTRTLTSTRVPRRFRIAKSRSSVNRPRSALRTREKSAAAMPVRA